MELAEPAGLGLGGLARVEQWVRAALDAQLERRARRRASRARPWRPRSRLSTIPATRQRSSGSCSPDGEVDAGDLEERDVRRRRRRRRCAPPRRARARSSSAGSPGRRSSGSGSRMASGLGSDAARLHVYASESPAPTRTSSTTPAQPLLLGQPPRTWRRSGIVSGTRSSTGRATSSMRSISRVTSRARQVGTVTSQSAETSKPNPSRVASLLVGGDVEPDQARRALRPEADDRPLGEPAVDVAWPVIRAPARSTSSRLASFAACSARYGSTPFSQRFDPAVRSASRSDVRRIPSGSKFAASSSTSVVAVRDLAVLAAHDRGERDRALGVGDDEVVRHRARGASRRACAAPRRRARGGRRCAPRRASCGRRRAAGCPRRA